MSLQSVIRLSIVKFLIAGLSIWLTASSAAATCKPDISGLIYLDGAPNIAEVIAAGQYAPAEIALKNQKGTIAIALSELRTHLAMSGVLVSFHAGRAADCKGAISLKIDEKSDLAVQGFQLQSVSGNMTITARTGVGLLYGSYELLHQMGYRWFASSVLWSSQPDKAAMPVLDTAQVHAPRFLFRGSHTFDAKVADAHLLWMARNRQNYIGSSGLNVTLAHALGFKLEGGGHNLISTILHSSRDMGGQTLVVQQPHWFGLTAAPSAVAQDPIPHNAETYTNPCLAKPALITFFASELAMRLIDGDLKDVSVVNLWPSDRPQLNLAPACLAEFPGMAPVEHLIRFYAGTMDVLQQALSERAPDRQITISGIAYYDTWELPDAKVFAALTARRNVDFKQILYVNERAYSSALNQKSQGTNSRISKAVGEWASALREHGITTGVCDYYNYSIYYGLPFTLAGILTDDINGYAASGVDLAIYMNPLSVDAGPHRVLETIRSRLFWNLHEPAKAIEADYYARMYRGTELATLYESVDRALSNVSEMFGNNSSLLTLLGQHKLWADPIFPQAAVNAEVSRFLTGGTHRLPHIRKTFFSPLESQFIGVSESVSLLKSAEQRVQVLVAADLSPDVRRRLAVDAPWISFSRAIYEALEAVALGSAPMHAGGIDREVAKQRHEAAMRDAVRFDKFGHTLSTLDQRETFKVLMGYARSNLDIPR